MKLLGCKMREDAGSKASKGNILFIIVVVFIQKAVWNATQGHEQAILTPFVQSCMSSSHTLFLVKGRKQDEVGGQDYIDDSMWT